MEDEIAIVLAAGRGARMGGRNKLLRDIKGAPLVSFAARAAAASRAARVLIVTGRDGEAVFAACGTSPRVVRVHNADFEEGLASSLRAGLQHAMGARAAAIVLGDMPGVRPETIDALFATLGGAYAAAAMVRGQLGHPVVLSARAMEEARLLTGDRGARRLLETHWAEVTRVDTEDAGALFDVDVPEDLFSAEALLDRRGGAQEKPSHER